MRTHRIVVDIFANSEKRGFIEHPDFGETLLPDWRPKPQRFAGTVGEAAFHKLDRSFDGDGLVYGYEQVKVIRHDDECVQAKFVFVAIMIENVEEELSGSVGLEQLAFIGN